MLRNSDINLTAAHFLKSDIKNRKVKIADFAEIIGYNEIYCHRMFRGATPVYFDVVVKYCSHFNIPIENVIQSK